jgi:hypothetical protein
MSTFYRPKPFEERPSQKVGVMGYIREHVSLVILPFATGAAGWLIGKNQKYAENTSPKSGFIGQYQEAVKNMLGREHKGGLYGSALFKAGILTSAFLLWRKDESKKLEVAETVASVKEIAPLHQTNDDLEKDNQLVTKMIAFEQAKQQQISHQQRLETRTENNTVRQK